MIIKVCHHFTLDTTVDVFTDHQHGDNELLLRKSLNCQYCHKKFQTQWDV